MAAKREVAISLEGDQLVAIGLLDPVVSRVGTENYHNLIAHPLIPSFFSFPLAEKCTVRCGALRRGGGHSNGRYACGKYILLMIDPLQKLIS